MPKKVVSKQKKEDELPLRKRRRTKVEEKAFVQPIDSEEEDDIPYDSSDEVDSPVEPSESSDFEEDSKMEDYMKAMVDEKNFNPNKKVVGVDIGSQNFHATLMHGELGKIEDVLYCSLFEYGPKTMSNYDLACAAGAMVRGNPQIFAPGRMLVVENQFPKNPDMPIIAGAVIGAGVALGMQYTPVFPDSMYTKWYGGSGGSNARNKARTQKLVSRVLTPQEKRIITKAVNEKKGRDEDRGYDPNKSDNHHGLDATAIGWYGRDKFSKINTYERREDDISSSDSDSD